MANKRPRKVPPAPRIISAQNVYTKKQKEWDELFMINARSAKPEDIQPFEVFAHYPYYAFVWERKAYQLLRITFYDRKDEPFFEDPDGVLGTYWYDIEPSRVELAYTMLRDLCPCPETRGGVEGFMIPLYESEQMSNVFSVNAYLRNLHFWESLIDPTEITPSDLRMFWMTKERYSEVRDMSEVRVIYNMLCHMNGSKIEPERIMQFREFFDGSSEERAEALSRFHQMMGRSITEASMHQREHEDRQREYDLRRNMLMNEFSKQAQLMQEVQARIRMDEERKMVMMEDLKHRFERMLGESADENNHLVNKMQEITRRQEQILEELKKHDIQ